MGNDLFLYTSASDDFQDMRKRDIIMPRLVLGQPTSPLVVDGVGTTGDLFDSSTKSVIAKLGTKIRIVPFVFWLEWIEWNPDVGAPKDKRMLARSVDPASLLAKRAEAFEKTQDDKKVAVTEYYNFICSIVGEDPSVPGYRDYSHLTVINFCRTSHRTGKGFLNKLSNAKFKPNPTSAPTKAPIWFNEWELFTSREKKDNNNFAVYQIGSSRPTPTEFHLDLKTTRDELVARKQEIVEKNSAEAEKEDKTPHATTDQPDF